MFRGILSCSRLGLPRNLLFFSQLFFYIIRNLEMDTLRKISIFCLNKSKIMQNPPRKNVENFFVWNGFLNIWTLCGHGWGGAWAWIFEIDVMVKSSLIMPFYFASFEHNTLWQENCGRYVHFSLIFKNTF